MKKYDVIALGELLVDFSANGMSTQGNSTFEACPGGAPCNVLAMLSRHKKKTSFIGRVGNDAFGRMLVSALTEAGVDTSHVLKDNDVNTTLAFVTQSSDGDREFSFYRKPGADMMLREEDVDEDYINSAHIFHFGTLSMTHEGVRKATKKAVNIAKSKGMLVSFDPNLRENLWDSLCSAKEQMDYGFRNCDILKVSDNEVQFFTGVINPEEGIKKLIEEYSIPLVFLTCGKEGSSAFYHGKKAYVPAFRVNVSDATGAGDTFMGEALAYILDHGMEDLAEENLKELLLKANAAAAIVTTRKGALKAMPDPEETERLIEKYNG